MNLERLRAVQAEEREADSLRPLADTFYQEVADYLTDLRRRRTAAAESAEDPFGDDEVRRLTDEIETAEEVAEAIYERRVGKLVKMASLAASAVPVDNEDGLTAEEAALFSDIVAQIEAHRTEVLAAFDAEGPSSPRANDEGATAPSETEPPTPPDEPPAAEEPAAGDGGSADDATGAADDARETTDGGDTERVTVRITRDVGEVFGVDERVYDLASEDVVTLPTANAKPLLERDAAEKVE